MTKIEPLPSIVEFVKTCDHDYKLGTKTIVKQVDPSVYYPFYYLDKSDLRGYVKFNIDAQGNEKCPSIFLAKDKSKQVFPRLEAKGKRMTLNLPAIEDGQGVRKRYRPFIEHVVVAAAFDIPINQLWAREAYNELLRDNNYNPKTCNYGLSNILVLTRSSSPKRPKWESGSSDDQDNDSDETESEKEIVQESVVQAPPLKKRKIVQMRTIETQTTLSGCISNDPQQIQVTLPFVVI